MVCEEPEGGGCRSKSFVHLWISMVCVWVWGVGAGVDLGVGCGCERGFGCE